jgi:DNA-directed RNA polymerase specialized sigma subunit
MHWLTVLERKILWLRAGKKPWKKIREDYGISQATASRRLNSALTKISYRLNNPEKYEKCEQS